MTSATPTDPAVSHACTVGDLVDVLDAAYPPSTAQSWDAVGLVCGDRSDPVGSVLLAVDPVTTVVDEAIERGVDLLVVHHPLLLRGVHSVAADTAKGRVLHRLIRSGIALYVAHTNADAAHQGVNEALADLIGLSDTAPLEPGRGPDGLTLVCYVPADALDRVIDAAAAAGAGVIGDYRRCGWSVTGHGTFEAGLTTNPTIGAAGDRSTVPEAKVEMVLPAVKAAAVTEAVRAVHPYEEPALHLLTRHRAEADTGIGRVGDLTDAITLHDLASRLADVLPPTAHGVRVSGPPQALVGRVALCGGAGDSLFGPVRAARADVYITADLRHHPASEAREHRPDGRPYLVDLSHWASEWPWLPRCAELLGTILEPAAITVSTRCTDPWTFRLPSPGWAD